MIQSESIWYGHSFTFLYTGLYIAEPRLFEALILLSVHLDSYAYIMAKRKERRTKQPPSMEGQTYIGKKRKKEPVVSLYAEEVKQT